MAITEMGPREWSFVMKNRNGWLTAAIVVSVGYAARRASEGEIRGPAAVERLYNCVAPVYDVAAWAFRPLGARRLQERAISLLDLQPGDTVYDLGCGTGVNLPVLARRVGERGRVVGVDLSSGMLDRARLRVERQKLHQVSLLQGDVRDVELWRGTNAVLATASLEMIPEHDAVVRRLADQLAPSNGRLAVGGIRRPPTWPGWAVALGRSATALFGVTRAYEDIQPWRSVRRHMDEIAFETAGVGSLYFIVARSRSAAGHEVQARSTEGGPTADGKD